MSPTPTPETEEQYQQRIDHLARTAVRGMQSVLADATIEQRFLAARLIPMQAVTLMAGAAGSGKSWLAYALALAVARGEPWLGAECAQGSVLICNYDNPQPELGRRWLRLGATAQDPIYFHSTDIDPLVLPTHAAELRSLVLRIPRIALVIFDSFRQCHICDENDSNEMRIVMAGLKSIAQVGPAVLVLHHLTKSTENPTSRGSGEIRGSVDAEIIVRDEESATWSKHRGWMMRESEREREFRIRDAGDRTLVTSNAPTPEEVELVAAELRRRVAAGESCKPRDVKSALELDTPKVTAIMKLPNIAAILGAQ